MWSKSFLIIGALGILWGVTQVLRSADAAPHVEWSPTTQEIGELEPYLTPMPKGAMPLNDYVRFYAGVSAEGKSVLYGVFVAPALLVDEDAKGERVRIVPLRPIP